MRTKPFVCGIISVPWLIYNELKEAYFHCRRNHKPGSGSESPPIYTVNYNSSRRCLETKTFSHKVIVVVKFLCLKSLTNKRLLSRLTDFMMTGLSDRLIFRIFYVKRHFTKGLTIFKWFKHQFAVIHEGPLVKTSCKYCSSTKANCSRTMPLGYILT